ncbi:uncharacterized protein BO95DRAFT_69187 [Aspergillus brunneoviolaceus CBS 621.78]|uniref:Uncharacterized protein n=1 Tax=Aspergillus brunneoviolaceus CBS 621.78 TaxID=1450534 RepID=A0ACD1GGC6_9EURO|nr:hypothetical protein BO95DRAFT_69187 [Aspergillus brunneoviolaceus CBS 621.78]RAH48136.1 hypothetical protein BO95DRAFT_69187 [Aspergillus brunneoviolaceus CBS 621.78]
MTSAVIADNFWPRKIVVRAVGARAHLTYLELLRAYTSIVPDISTLQLRLGIASALDLMIVDIETVKARGSTWFPESKFCTLCGSGSHRIASHRIASWSNCLCLVGFPIASSTVVAVDQTRHMDHILIFPHEDRSQGSSASTKTEETKYQQNSRIYHE